MYIRTFYISILNIVLCVCTYVNHCLMTCLCTYKICFHVLLIRTKKNWVDVSHKHPPNSFGRYCVCVVLIEGGVRDSLYLSHMKYYTHSTHTHLVLVKPRKANTCSFSTNEKTRAIVVSTPSQYSAHTGCW